MVLIVIMRMIIAKFRMIQVTLNNYRDRAKIDMLYNECQKSLFYAKVGTQDQSRGAKKR